MGMLSKAAAIGALWVSTPAHGEVELSGSFTATQACRAFQSIPKQSNPGNETIEPGRAYPILGKNSVERRQQARSAPAPRQAPPSISPGLTTLPELASSPVFFVIGCDSPVNAAWSIDTKSPPVRRRSAGKITPRRILDVKSHAVLGGLHHQYDRI
jgi:hypothetical protein